MQPGEYPQPLKRPQQVMFPLVNGYTTARMNVASPYTAQGGTVTQTWGTIPDYTVYGLFENIGAIAVTMQMLVTPTISSGGRTNLGTPVAIQPSGRVVQNFWPTAQYVEFTCTAGGPSQIRAQFTSNLDWTMEGFSKFGYSSTTTQGTVTAAPYQDPYYPWQTVSGNYAPFGSWAT